MQIYVVIAAVASLLVTANRARGADQEAIVSEWLSRQTNLQTWAAEFVQTRRLKGLAQPLVSTGRVWFAAPQNFRWELGSNQTIAIRSNNTMLVLYPRLKRAEQYDFGAAQRSEWKDSLRLLQSGFPRSRSDLDEQFRVLAVTATNHQYRLELQPKKLGARRMMPRIHLFLSTAAQLTGTELVFGDGSTLRNDFRDARTDVDPEGKFHLIVPPDFRLVEPLQGVE